MPGPHGRPFRHACPISHPACLPSGSRFSICSPRVDAAARKRNDMIEKLIERTLVASRWLMAPFYLGLVVALAVVLFKFVQELWHFVSLSPQLSEEDTVLGALAVIDLALLGSLILIV